MDVHVLLFDEIGSLIHISQVVVSSSLSLGSHHRQESKEEDEGPDDWSPLTHIKDDVEEEAKWRINDLFTTSICGLLHNVAHATSVPVDRYHLSIFRLNYILGHLHCGCAPVKDHHGQNVADVEDHEDRHKNEEHHSWERVMDTILDGCAKGWNSCKHN